MNAILIHSDEIEPAGLVTLKDKRASHIVNILKPQIGQPLQVGILDGPLGEGIVEAMSPGQVVLRCHCPGPPPAVPSLDLLLALPRPKILKRVLPQIASIGVRRILLTNAHRVERFYFDTHVLNQEHYLPYLIEGLSQARDTRIPQVTIHKQFKIMLEDELDQLCPNASRVVLEQDDGPLLKDLAPSTLDSRMLLAVGPEGGWRDFELELLKLHGFQAASLSDRTLRSETACTAGLVLARQILSAVPLQ